MIRLVLPAAVAAIALGTMAAAQAQTVQPMQQPSPYTANASITATGQVQPGPDGTTNINATITGQPQPGPGEYTYPGSPGYAVAPPPGQSMPYAQPMQPMSPRTTWIPGHYNWDPATSNYVWTSGQYIEAPTATAQWLPGHWEQTPTAWIWINGGWH
ncbi:MAG TPA: hypothetical protein VME45_05205 [Stellaceae bacterium]|nr:hypothetical protein [Stellaceae bacterium]